MARFDVRGPATSCLKLGDERTQRRHRESDAFDPKATSSSARIAELGNPANPAPT